MSAKQQNAKVFNPNDLDLTRVATYQREIRAPLVRVWENVLDWEHLPHLHASTFTHIELDAAGDWGWRTWSDPDHQAHVELVVADSDSYVARTYQGRQQLSEIWTTLKAAGESTDIEVEFHFANVADNADALGEIMLGVYTRLWDEDEEMMCQRHRRLAEQRNNTNEVYLGSREDLTRCLSGGDQVVFQLKRREFQLRLHEGEMLVHPTICPHLLGPLQDSELHKGLLTCPWHGYQFDLATGECISPTAANCRLPANPELQEQDGQLIARLA
jgi:nitrite reductase/ring-hydroxylating ferredoxin subunit